MYPQAIEEFKIAGQLSGDKYEIDSAAAMEEGFRVGGWNGALKKALEVDLAQRKKSFGSSYRIAALYAQLGDKERAFEWLNTAVREHDEPLMIGIKTEFQMDPLRSDPRFAELARKIGLPQ
jgi:hypothetical protein